MAYTPTRTAPAEVREQEQPGQVPDVELVRRAQQGDGSAFAELVGRHQRQLYRLALRMTGSEADAQEVLQEAFLNAYQKLPNFRGEAQFSSWLYRIAANSALMRLRRKRRAPIASNCSASISTGPFRKSARRRWRRTSPSARRASRSCGPTRRPAVCAGTSWRGRCRRS